MSQWVINYNGTVLLQQKFCYFNFGEINSNTEEWKCKYFDANIKLKLVDYISPPKESV